MSNYNRKKESGNRDDYTNLIKSVYESSVASDDKTVAQLVDDIKMQLLKIMK